MSCPRTFSVLRRVVLAQVAVHLVPLVDEVDDHGRRLQEGQAVGAAHAKADVAGVRVDAALLQQGQVSIVVVRPPALLPKLDEVPVCGLGSGDILRSKCPKLFFCNLPYKWPTSYPAESISPLIVVEGWTKSLIWSMVMTAPLPPAERPPNTMVWSSLSPTRVRIVCWDISRPWKYTEKHFG